MKMNANGRKKIAVLYHGDCNDGFGGAYAAWKKFGSRAEYQGLSRDQKPPLRIRGKELYFIDFTYPAPITKKFIARNRRVVILDHHKSAEKTARLAQEYRFSADRSGAALAWRYFHPHKAMPRLLRHIEDVDVWRFRLPHSAEFYAWVSSYPLEFALWDRLAQQLEHSPDRRRAVREGAAIVRARKMTVENLVENEAIKVRFAGRAALAVNSPVLASEIGHALRKKQPPLGIIWNETTGGQRCVSLRGDGSIDVARIAEQFGGGGHKNAAGFVVPADKPLPWKIIRRRGMV